MSLQQIFEQGLEIIGNYIVLIFFRKKIEDLALYFYAFAIALIVVNEILLRQLF